MITLALDPETGKPSAFAGDSSNGDKLFLPEFAYGLSIESIADYIIVKVSQASISPLSMMCTKLCRVTRVATMIRKFH